MEASISVIIPAYNRESLIGATLESLLSQTVPAREIIVVDDGSTDGTVRAASAFGPAVRVIRQDNRGPAAARNTGFNQSNGEFIHFFDSDDIAVINKHEVQLKSLRETGADIAYAPWIKGTFSGRRFSPENGVYQQQGLPSGDLVKALLCNWSIVPHACLFRREIIEKAGGFPENLFVGEDQLFFLRCLLAGSKVVHSPDTLELYRVENADKITASPQGAVKRLVEWARFLVMANRECRTNGLNPSSWFNFQKRAYSVHCELIELDFPEKESLLTSLEELFAKQRRQLYRATGLYHRIRQGFQHRISGNRGASDFMMGSLSPFQQELVHKSGYHIG